MGTFFRLGGNEAHHPIHSREVSQMLQATPHRLRTWLVAAAAPDKATEWRHPAHRLAQRGWTVRRYRTGMDGTRQGLAFRDLQQHLTRHLRHRSRQHDGITYPPSKD